MNRRADVYLFGQVLGTHSFLLKDGFLQPDEYSEIREQYFLPGGETGTAATVLDALGVAVREAFYALNRPRLDELAAARAAEESKALLARAVSGGAQRPREGGGSGAAALLRSDYAALPRERQLALKQRIREAAARGEKMYP